MAGIEKEISELEDSQQTSDTHSSNISKTLHNCKEQLQDLQLEERGYSSQRSE